MTDESEARRAPWLRRLWREPLLWFLAIGAALFLVAGHVTGEPDDSTIVVDPALRTQLSERYKAQMGGFPTPEQMHALVDRYVREEMLYREALRLGFDKDDDIVRQRMIQKMEYFAEIDPDAIPEAEARAWYAAHKAEFAIPATTSFRQLYFSPDSGGWDAAEARAKAALASGSPAGERSPLQGEYTGLGPKDATQLFGDSPLVKALAAAPQGRWSGPFKSGYGWHLVFVTGREGASEPPFEEIADAVRAAMAEAQRKERLDAQLAELRSRYEVRESGGE